MTLGDHERARPPSVDDEHRGLAAVHGRRRQRDRGRGHRLADVERELGGRPHRDRRLAYRRRRSRRARCGSPRSAAGARREIFAVRSRAGRRASGGAPACPARPRRSHPRARRPRRARCGDRRRVAIDEPGRTNAPGSTWRVGDLAVERRAQHAVVDLERRARSSAPCSAATCACLLARRPPSCRPRSARRTCRRAGCDTRAASLRARRCCMRVHGARLHRDLLFDRRRVPAVERRDHLAALDLRARPHEHGVDVGRHELRADLRLDPRLDGADVAARGLERRRDRRDRRDALGAVGERDVVDAALAAACRAPRRRRAARRPRRAGSSGRRTARGTRIGRHRSSAWTSASGDAREACTRARQLELADGELDLRRRSAAPRHRRARPRSRARREARVGLIWFAARRRPSAAARAARLCATCELDEYACDAAPRSCSRAASSSAARTRFLPPRRFARARRRCDRRAATKHDHPVPVRDVGEKPSPAGLSASAVVTVAPPARP